MILLWGLASDRPMAAVRAELAQLGRTAILIDQRVVLETTAELSADAEVAGFVEWGGLRVDLSRVTAAYVRPHDPTAVPGVAKAGRDSPEARHAVAVYEALRLWCELTPATVVSRLSAMGSNGSKPYQMEQIRRAGFSVPDTLLTTDPGAAADFCDKHGDVIYKSVSGVRSVVSRVTPERRATLQAVSACPTQFQRYVPGVDYRVHVVDGDLFVCELSSAADDYRYAEREGKELRRREAVVPSDCAARCLSLASDLGLRVAGIDLRRTPQDEWFCFEVNPSPGFNFFDTDGRIAKRLAKFLASPS